MNSSSTTPERGKQITHLKCNACESGIVTLTVSKVKDAITASVKDCNQCKKSFGIKSIAGLTVMDSEDVNALYRKRLISNTNE